MVSPLPSLLENAILRFGSSEAWIPDPESGLPIPQSGETVEIVAFVKPSVGLLGGRKLSQFVQPGADLRGEDLECYLIRPMELPPELLYQDVGVIERFEPSGSMFGKILQIKADTRLPLVTTIVGRHLYLTVEWTNHGR
jgi:hypothetical protein